LYEPRTDRSIDLIDGRTLAFAEWGDQEGPAVVYFHGTPHSRLWCPDIVATHAAGVHLVTVDRPGYGRSDPLPAESTIRDWTDDMVQLADALGVARFGVVGWSGGALYAAACAAAIPERLTGAGEIGGAGWPVDEQPGVLDELDGASRQVHERARTDRLAAVRLAEELNAGWITEWQSRPESVMDGTASPEDIRHFEDSVWAANFFDAVREALRPGPRCYAWDAVAQLGWWGFTLEDVAPRFCLWHGAHDEHERMASVAYWASRMPDARVTIWEDSGHFAVVDHWGEILRAVIGG
jgi:pimeloyl-ACP methyl ester carboxylesterase